MLRGDFAHGSLHFGEVAFLYVPIMRSDRESFSLNERARDADEFFPKLFFRCIECRQKLLRLLSSQSAWSGNIKSVAASIKDPVDTNARTNVPELPAAEHSHGYFRREPAQDCPSGVSKHRLVRPTDDWRKRTVVIEKNRKAAVARISDFFDVLKCQRKHIRFNKRRKRVTTLKG